MCKSKIVEHKHGMMMSGAFLCPYKCTLYSCNRFINAIHYGDSPLALLKIACTKVCLVFKYL